MTSSGDYDIFVINWIAAVTGSEVNKPVEQVRIEPIVLLLMSMVIAMLQVILKKVQPLAPTTITSINIDGKEIFVAN